MYIYLSKYKIVSHERKKRLTTLRGAPIYHYADSQNVGARWPLLLHYYFLQ